MHGNQVHHRDFVEETKNCQQKGMSSGYPFENLVFEGGGSKGAAYSGAISVLEERGIISDIRRFGGTSIGAVVAMLLALGYTSKDIDHFMKNELSEELLLDGGKCRRCCNFLPNILCGYGWSKGHNLGEWLGEKVKTKTGNADFTFENLYDKNGKELCVVVANLNRKMEEYCHPKTTPDMPIKLAVLMSISMPGLFQPIQYRHHQLDPISTFVDGGIFCNYPIHCFDGWWLSMGEKKDSFLERMDSIDVLQTILSREYRFHGYNPKTLGFVVFSDDEAEMFRFYFEDRLDTKLSPADIPDTKIGRKKKKTMKEKMRLCEETLEATDAFLKVMKKYDQDGDNRLSKDELTNLFKDRDFPKQFKQMLFGKESCADIFRKLKKSNTDKLHVSELLSYLEDRGTDISGRFLGYHAEKINSFGSYVGSIVSGVLLNLNRIFVEGHDLHRTVGINTGHIGTCDFDAEQADVDFLYAQARKSTEAYLNHYKDGKDTRCKDRNK